MNITFHGHSCVQVEGKGFSLIIDPFLSGNPQFKGNKEDIEVNTILLTHGHQDHVGDTVDLARKHDALVVAPFELATYLGWQGCNVHAMHIGGAHDFNFGRVKLTQAFHGSGLVLDDKQQIVYMGMPAGILLTIDGKTIYHAGDTSLFSDMKLIGELNSIELAFLPIGDNYTMGPDDALLAAGWLHANKVVPVHYNTFPLIEQDAQAFAVRLRSKGIEGVVMAPGESIRL